MELLLGCGRQPDAVVVTDRPCGAEAECKRFGIVWRRIEDRSKEGFSAEAAAWLFEENKVDWTCLFFSRLVTPALLARGICVNIHPALLPVFPGLGAVRQAIESRCRFIGATAHMVDEEMDAGPIIAQVVAPVPPRAALECLNRISFAQKVYLFLVLWELAENHVLAATKETNHQPVEYPVLSWANPALRNKKLARAFDEFVKKEGIEWVRT